MSRMKYIVGFCVALLPMTGTAQSGETMIAVVEGGCTEPFPDKGDRWGDTERFPGPGKGTIALGKAVIRDPCTGTKVLEIETKAPEPKSPEPKK